MTAKPSPAFPKSCNFDSIKQLKHKAVRSTSFVPGETLKSLFDRWIKNPQKQIFIHGVQGNGKTTSLLWLYHELVDLGVDVQYVSVRELVDEARNRIQNKQSIPAMLNRFMDAGCLILDDLAAERRTDFSFSEVVYPIITHRMDRDPAMPTIIASNLDYNRLVQWYAQSDAYQADRLVSRIMHQCVEVHLSQPTFRVGVGTMKVVN